MAISGVLVLNDDGPEATPYSLDLHETAKNISDKPIQLLVIQTSHSSDPDASPIYTYSNDYFFSPKILGSGNVADISIAGLRYGPRHETSSPPRFSPTAEVIYVEFADGTHWGDPESAQHLYQIRASTLVELHTLKNAYESGGDEAFVGALLRAENHTLPGTGGLQSLYDSSGLEAAEIRAWEMLEAANSHVNREPKSLSIVPR